MAAMLVAALLCPVYNWLFVSHLGWGLTGAALANDAVQAGQSSGCVLPWCCAFQRAKTHLLPSCCHSPCKQSSHRNPPACASDALMHARKPGCN